MILMSIEESNVERYRFRLSMLAPKYWTTWLGVALYYIVTLLPLSLVDSLGCRLGRYVASKNKKRFNIVKTNLSLCFPDKNDEDLRQMVAAHFEAQFRSLMHYFILWWRPARSIKKRMQVEGLEQIAHYREQGKQVIVLLTHNVGLDFAAASIAMEYSSIAPYKQVRNEVADWLIANGRMRFGKRSGGRLFTRDDGLKPLIRDTRAGKVLIYLADEDLGAENSVFVPFFGVQKATIPMLGRLAKLCDAVVLPCVACYQPHEQRYRIQLLPALDDFPQGDELSDSKHMNEAIEQAILECPVQYLWTLRYFQTRPAGEASVYD